MKIYAVTKGFCSNKCICALVLSKEKAEKLKILYSATNEIVDILEFEDSEGEEVRAFWKYYPDSERIEILNFPFDYNNLVDMIGTNDDDICSIIVCASDIDCAKKKAKDLLAKYEER